MLGGMTRCSRRVAIIAAMTIYCASGNLAEAASCKTLKGEMVAFGEQSTRSYAESALDKAIVAWETRAGVKAEPKDRKVSCKVYISVLNEFECKAEAVVCRK